METARFREGDMLIVAPADTDDPEAQERAGSRCRHLRHLYGALGGDDPIYAVVQFSSNGKPITMRSKDLRKESDG